jgi:hypothetical protein
MGKMMMGMGSLTMFGDGIFSMMTEKFTSLAQTVVPQSSMARMSPEPLEPLVEIKLESPVSIGTLR